MLQKAIESYVYSVLGSQVKTRWVIVGQGAKSYQTQVIFHQIVKETIVLSNDATLISNMRSAIKGSNVVLNMAVIPGIILIPRSLLILDEPIKGYNNVLTIAKKNMQFGENEQCSVVKTEKKVQRIAPIVPTTAPSPVLKEKSQLALPSLLGSSGNNQVVLILGSSVALGSLLIYLLL